MGCCVVIGWLEAQGQMGDFSAVLLFFFDSPPPFLSFFFFSHLHLFSRSSFIFFFLCHHFSSHLLSVCILHPFSPCSLSLLSISSSFNSLSQCLCPPPMAFHILSSPLWFPSLLSYHTIHPSIHPCLLFSFLLPLLVSTFTFLQALKSVFTAVTT